MKPCKQTDLLKLLKRRKSVTVATIHKHLGFVQAYDLIKKLRAKGHNIETRMIKGRDRYNKAIRYGEFSLRAMK